MEKPRFVETGSGSFYGDYLYDQVVPAQHFLRQLKQIIAWERLVKRGKLKVFEEMLEEIVQIVQIAQQGGIQFGSIQIVDSVHSIANVNTDKDQKRQDKGERLPLETYAADKAYDDGENHYNLEVGGLYSAIRLKKTRTEKKDDNKQVWLDLCQTPYTSEA